MEKSCSKFRLSQEKGDNRMSFQPLNTDVENKIKESFYRQGFMDFIGAEITDIGPGYCEIQVIP